MLPLRWERVDMTELVFRVDETKTGAPLELPITRQLTAILDRRRAEIATLPGGLRDWVFPSSASASGHVVDLAHFYGLIGETGGTKFWYHALRNCFITVAERDLLLPRTLTKRLVNHVRPNDITEGYAADWTIGQLREPAQGIADRIDALMNAPVAAAPANPAIGGNKSSNVARVPLRRGPGSGRRDGAGHGAGSSGLGQARRRQSTCHSWDRRGGASYRP